MEKIKISIENIHYSIRKSEHEKFEIIKGVSLQIFQGESIVILGLSGSGKSTLLKICAGLFHPTSGQILIDGLNIYNLRQRKKHELMEKLGFVFQNSGLLSNMNVFNNIALSLRYHGKHKKNEIEKIVNDKLSSLDLLKLKNYFPDSLSPGQRKLISFARETIAKTEILFLDEPTTNVDRDKASEITEYIKNYVYTGGTAITITSDLELSNAVEAKRMIIMHEGSIYKCDNLEAIKRSNDPIIKQVMKSLSKEKEIADEMLKIMENDDIF
ncbi:MAG: ATP-binding cassette domain-containing protein [Spirochaetota bacterium]|nr:ATP-binding cassette domain-containing protein [Spirochaetota bacterium]